MTPSWFQSAPHTYPLLDYLIPWDGLWAESSSRLCFLLGSSWLTRGETCVSLSLEVQLVCLLPLSARSDVKLLSCVWLFGIPWTVAHQAPPSMAFSRQEYWSGLPLPSPTVVYSVQKMNFHLMTLLLLQLFFYCLNYPIIKELRSFPTFKSQSQWCNSCSFSLPD